MSIPKPHPLLKFGALTSATAAFLNQKDMDNKQKHLDEFESTLNLRGIEEQLKGKDNTRKTKHSLTFGNLKTLQLKEKAVSKKNEAQDKVLLRNCTDFIIKIQAKIDLCKNVSVFKTIYDQFMFCPYKNRDQRDLDYDSFIKEIATKIQQESIKRHEVIFHEGYDNTKIYFVVEGECIILVPKNPEEIEKDYKIFKYIQNDILDDPESSNETFNIENAKNTVRENYSDKLANYLEEQDFQDDDFKFIITHWKKFKRYYEDFICLLSYGNNKYYQNGNFTYKIIKTITNDQFYAEDALVSEAPRAETMITRVDTKLLYLKKKDCDHTVNEFVKNELLLKDFLNNYFQTDISKGDVADLQNLFEGVRLEKHQSIFDEGDTVDNIYFIREGSVQVGMYVESTPYNDKFGNPKVLNPKMVNLETLSNNSMFGHEDIFLGGNIRSYSAFAKETPTFVFKFNKIHIKHIIKIIEEIFPNTQHRAADNHFTKIILKLRSLYNYQYFL